MPQFLCIALLRILPSCKIIFPAIGLSLRLVCHGNEFGRLLPVYSQFSSLMQAVNALMRYFSGDTLRCILLKEKKFLDSNFTEVFSWGTNWNMSAWVQVMDWRQTGDKLIPDQWWSYSLMHICFTSLQWVNITILAESIISQFQCFIMGYKDNGLFLFQSFGDQYQLPQESGEDEVMASIYVVGTGEGKSEHGALSLRLQKDYITVTS